MTVFRTRSASVWMCAFLLTAAVHAETHIVVNVGPYESAQQAGHSEARVDWLDSDPSDDIVCTECYAALELQAHLREMAGTGEDFMIVDDGTLPDGPLILVGGPKSNDVSERFAAALDMSEDALRALGPEGYRIKSEMVDGRPIALLAGGSRVGTLYAAYDFLHRLGFRWFAPGDLHREIPKIERIPDIDIIERPSFRTRGFHAWNDRADQAFLLWMARNRLNYWCVEQSNHPLLRKLGLQLSCGGHDSQWLFLNPRLPYPYAHADFVDNRDAEQDPYPISKECQGDADGNGKLSYFEAHPEWFPLVGGHRVPGLRGDRGQFGTNFCSSNIRATNEFMKNFVRALIDGPYRGADVVRFWTLDVGKWCQCRACQDLGTPTDRNLLLVHALDQAIKKARAEGSIHRRIVIRFLAYADVLEPPSRALPETFDYETCSATFFPIVRSYVRNFDDAESPRNAHYNRQLGGWATDPDRYYRGQLCIGEYYNVSGYRSLPVCFMHTMANDIPFYYRVGARHFHYMHVTTGDWGNKALTNYQMARQLWDVETDCSALWEDYFSRRYGPAAETMRAFYQSLEQMFCNVSELKYGLARRLDRGEQELFPTPILRYRPEPNLSCTGPTLMEIVDHGGKCRELIDRGLTLELPDRIRSRISEDERMFTYGERTVNYYKACVEAFRLGRSGRRTEAIAHFHEARRLAELLRADTTSVKRCYWPDQPNALVASNAVRAVDHLEKLLGPSDSSDGN